MTATLDIDLAGTRVRLDAGRALVWPEQRTLFVADLHLGKGAAFRRAGIAIPSGDSAADLQRLSDLIVRHAVRRVMLLGDIVHAPPSPDEPAMTALRALGARHADIAFTAIRGNHDRHAERVLAELGWQWVDTLQCGPFALRHAPESDPDGYVLAGHLHPVIKLRTRLERLRVPVFWFQADCGVLPSFGGFTGGWEIPASAQGRCYGITGGRIAALRTPPVRRPRSDR